MHAVPAGIGAVEDRDRIAERHGQIDAVAGARPGAQIDKGGCAAVPARRCVRFGWLRRRLGLRRRRRAERHAQVIAGAVAEGVRGRADCIPAVAAVLEHGDGLAVIEQAERAVSRAGAGADVEHSGRARRADGVGQRRRVRRRRRRRGRALRLQVVRAHIAGVAAVLHAVPAGIGAVENRDRIAERHGQVDAVAGARSGAQVDKGGRAGREEHGGRAGVAAGCEDVVRAHITAVARGRGDAVPARVARVKDRDLRAEGNGLEDCVVGARSRAQVDVGRGRAGRGRMGGDRQARQEQQNRKAEGGQPPGRAFHAGSLPFRIFCGFLVRSLYDIKTFYSMEKIILKMTILKSF